VCITYARFIYLCVALHPATTHKESFAIDTRVCRLIEFVIFIEFVTFTCLPHSLANVASVEAHVHTYAYTLDIHTQTLPHLYFLSHTRTNLFINRELAEA